MIALYGVNSSFPANAIEFTYQRIVRNSFVMWCRYDKVYPITSVQLLRKYMIRIVRFSNKQLPLKNFLTSLMKSNRRQNFPLSFSFLYSPIRNEHCVLSTNQLKYSNFHSNNPYAYEQKLPFSKITIELINPFPTFT